MRVSDQVPQWPPKKARMFSPVESRVRWTASRLLKAMRDVMTTLSRLRSEWLSGEWVNTETTSASCRPPGVRSARGWVESSSACPSNEVSFRRVSSHPSSSKKTILISSPYFGGAIQFGSLSASRPWVLGFDGCPHAAASRKFPSHDGPFRPAGPRHVVQNPVYRVLIKDAEVAIDRKSTRLNSSHDQISYAV